MGTWPISLRSCLRSLQHPGIRGARVLEGPSSAWLCFGRSTRMRQKRRRAGRGLPRIAQPPVGCWHPQPAVPSASAPVSASVSPPGGAAPTCPSSRGRRPCKGSARPSGFCLRSRGARLACLCPHVRGRVRGVGEARPRLTRILNYFHSVACWRERVTRMRALPHRNMRSRGARPRQPLPEAAACRAGTAQQASGPGLLPSCFPRPAGSGLHVSATVNVFRVSSVWEQG